MFKEGSHIYSNMLYSFHTNTPPITIGNRSPSFQIKEGDHIYTCYIGIKGVIGDIRTNDLYFCIDKRIMGDMKWNETNVNYFNDMCYFKIKSIEELSNTRYIIQYTKDGTDTHLVLVERALSGNIVSYLQTDTGGAYWVTEKPDVPFQRTGHPVFDTLAALFGAE
jgi:hypothetical protein